MLELALDYFTTMLGGYYRSTVGFLQCRLLWAVHCDCTTTQRSFAAIALSDEMQAPDRLLKIASDWVLGVKVAVEGALPYYDAVLVPAINLSDC